MGSPLGGERGLNVGGLNGRNKGIALSASTSFLFMVGMDQSSSRNSGATGGGASGMGLSSVLVQVGSTPVWIPLGGGHT